MDDIVTLAEVYAHYRAAGGTRTLDNLVLRLLGSATRIVNRHRENRFARRMDREGLLAAGGNTRMTDGHCHLCRWGCDDADGRGLDDGRSLDVK